VLEQIADAKLLGAKTLFATHYHELTELEGKVPGVKNYCVTVKEQGDDIIFLRKIIRGGADHSYGIEVARLAGLPNAVIARSREILSALNEADITKHAKADDEEINVIYSKKKPKENVSGNRIIINELTEIDVDALSPRDALQKLYELKAKYKQ
jgi:DNA mismatch repair protein MutS